MNSLFKFHSALRLLFFNLQRAYKLSISLLLSSSLLIINNVGFAWNASAHDIATQIAIANMTPKAKAQFAELVYKLSPEYGEKQDEGGLIEVGAWADRIKSEDVRLYDDIHFTNMFFTVDPSITKTEFPFLDPITEHLETDYGLGDYIDADYTMARMLNTITSNQSRSIDKAYQLRFFVHLFEDIHNPLHSAARVVRYSRLTTPLGSHVQADRGGNRVFVVLESENCNPNKSINLHALWDNMLGAVPLNLSIVHVKEEASKIQQQYPPSYFGDLVSSRPPGWFSNDGVTIAEAGALSDLIVKESFVMAKDNAYKTADINNPSNIIPVGDNADGSSPGNDPLLPPDQCVPLSYESSGQELSKQRVALAGYRLANLFNELWK